jgi:prolyl oligopeptidase
MGASVLAALPRSAGTDPSPRFLLRRRKRPQHPLDLQELAAILAVKSSPRLQLLKERKLLLLADAQFATDRHLLKAIFDRPDNIPYPYRRGGRILNVWQDDAHPRGLWRTTSLASFRSKTPAWEVLLDLDALAAQEGEDWVWQGGATLPPAHERAIIFLSRGGSDAVVLREFDLSSREFVPDGFYLPESRSSIAWLDRDTLLLSSSLG